MRTWLILFTELFFLMILISCAGPQGPRGAQGVQGPAGPTGPQGPAGADGTQIIPIKLCPQNTVYPSSFPEYALLINSALYAVYWDGHNSWLAQIVAGHYVSTSTSAPCSFMVHSNGTVTYD